MHSFLGIPINTHNVALQTHGATCNASSSYNFTHAVDKDHSCYDAIDGEYGEGDNTDKDQWATQTDGRNAWIKVTFKKKYRIVAFSITNRAKPGIDADLISEANVEFSYGLPIPVSVLTANVYF
eukprot:GHVR01174057.1.p1 GENE.GHVR01174057.1~~GHVR01174057.1.p1  ORF type:complete len:124 (+),score=9.52 GHVR01174057.1:1029-1400(+)